MTILIVIGVTTPLGDDELPNFIQTLIFIINCMSYLKIIM